MVKRLHNSMTPLTAQSLWDKLPFEVHGYIFSFDPTFYEEMNDSLRQIRTFRARMVFSLIDLSERLKWTGVWFEDTFFIYTHIRKEENHVVVAIGDPFDYFFRATDHNTNTGYFRTHLFSSNPMSVSVILSSLLQFPQS